MEKVTPPEPQSASDYDDRTTAAGAENGRRQGYSGGKCLQGRLAPLATEIGSSSARPESSPHHCARSRVLTPRAMQTSEALRVAWSREDASAERQARIVL